MSMESTDVHTDINNVCLMLQQTKAKCIPEHVRLLFEHFKEESPKETELMFMLVYVVCLEAGFITEEEYKLCQTRLIRLPATALFHVQNLREISRLKPTYFYDSEQNAFRLNLRSLLQMRNERPDILSSVLSAIAIGSELILTISPKGTDILPGFSICLNANRYIKPEEEDSNNICSRFQKLRELNRVLREELLVPRLNQLFVLLGCNISASLEGLPYDVYDEIFKYLSQENVKKMAHVSKTLYHSSVTSRYISDASWEDDDDEAHSMVMFEF